MRGSFGLFESVDSFAITPCLCFFVTKMVVSFVLGVPSIPGCQS